METASVPGSLPGAPRNGRPEGTFYTHWRGRPLPVIPYVERNLGGRPPARSSSRSRCPECDHRTSSKAHRRQCLGVVVPPGPEQ